MLQLESIAGVILAGGLSRRMGGGDKALAQLDGKPLVARVIERLRGQARPIALNANGDPMRFSAFGLPILADATADFAGPLAGVLAGMRWAARAAPKSRFIVTAACDTPFFPRNLVERLLDAAGENAARIALAASAGRVHPVFALWPVALAADLADCLDRGQRKVLSFVDRHPHVVVEFALTAEAGLDPFFNANTPEDLAEAERLLTDGTMPRECSSEPDDGSRFS